MRRFRHIGVLVGVLAGVIIAPQVASAEEWGSDFGPLTISYGPPVSGSWRQSTTMIGQITGGCYDPATRTLTFTYTQDWNQVRGEARFTLSADGLTLSGTWTQVQVAGTGAPRGGSWTARRSSPSELLGFTTPCPGAGPSAPPGDVAAPPAAEPATAPPAPEPDTEGFDEAILGPCLERVLGTGVRPEHPNFAGLVGGCYADVAAHVATLEILLLDPLLEGLGRERDANDVACARSNLRNQAIIGTALNWPAESEFLALPLPVVVTSEIDFCEGLRKEREERERERERGPLLP